MKSKMTTNSQILTTEPKKKQKQKQTKQTNQTGTESQMEITWGDIREGEKWGKWYRE